MKILIMNGPNLNLLGSREPGIYGSESMEDYFEKLEEKFRGVDLQYFQSNHEGELIDKLQTAKLGFDGVVLNAGAYSHTSLAIADTIKAIQTPVVEVHISNTFARENFRHHSYLSPVVKGVIVGFGMDVYKLAVVSLID